MCWLKRDLWKVGIALAVMLLLLMTIAGLPVSANPAISLAGFAGPGTVTVQVTPTEDATVTALNKEKLAQEVQQLKNQNEPHPFGWLRTNASILLSTLVVVIGGLIGLWRWFGDRRSEREKRAEERFQSTVAGLGEEKEGAKIAAAILLRSFLRPGYEQFYMQIFDLAVANLRAFRTSAYPDRTLPLPEDPDTPLPLTTLRHEMITVFKEAFLLARDSISNGKGKKEALQSLDATGIQLDNAYLYGADLQQAWMPQASLQKANLVKANLSNANLEDAILKGAALFGGTNLRGANLITADLRAGLSEADLSGANLWGARLRGAFLENANFSGANLREAKLNEADLSGANPEDALSLEKANLCGVKGLTEDQLKKCKDRGANIDESPTTSPSQSPVSPPPSS